MNDKDKQNLIVYITYLNQPDFEEWVTIATDEEIDVAFEHYKEQQHQRVETELQKYEAQAREVIQKAMRK
jgi:hypothetical protein